MLTNEQEDLLEALTQDAIDELVMQLEAIPPGSALGGLLRTARHLGYEAGKVDGERAARVAMEKPAETMAVAERGRAAHPMQPVVLDRGGVAHFKSNTLVRYLLDAGPYDLDHLHLLPNIPPEDHVQLAQLIGYSVSGFGDLSFVPRDVVQEAGKRAARLAAPPPPVPRRIFKKPESRVPPKTG